MKNLGLIQQEVYAALKRHGSWAPGCGWLWDTYSGTRRVLDSLVRRGYATSTKGQGGDKILYRPIHTPIPPIAKSEEPPIRSAVLLSGGHVVNGEDVPGMLKRQHAILLKLSKELAARSHDADSAAQKAIADANMLGLEVAARWEETLHEVTARKDPP